MLYFFHMEQPPKNTEELERFESEPIDEATKQHRMEEQKLEDLRERGSEEGLHVDKHGELITVKEAELRNMLRNEPVEPLHSDSPIKTETFMRPKIEASKPWWKKAVTTLAFGLTGLFATAKGTDSTNVSMEKMGDKTVATKNLEMKKLQMFQEQQEVAGIKLDGKVAVPTSDTTKEVFFLSFTGEDNDPNAIENMRAAVKELGYELGDDQLLALTLREHGMKLAKMIRSGISLEKSHSEGDDTRSQNIERDNVAPEHQVFSTIDPLGRINRAEKQAIRDLGAGYDYSVLVYKKKDSKTANYNDVATVK
jgi:hypothetical protein